MTAYDDDADRLGEYADRLGEYEAETRPVTCNRCHKADLYWQEVFTNTGAKWRLFENGKQHVCAMAGSADDFEDLG